MERFGDPTFERHLGIARARRRLPVLD